MRLTAAARYFDQLACQDAYDNSVSFHAQFDLFDDTRRDGLTADRRIVSVAPNVPIPSRRVFSVVESDRTHHWIVGDIVTDFFKDQPIRRKAICHEAQGLAYLYTFAGVLTNAPSGTAYSAKAWMKGSKELEVSSGIYNVWDLYFARTEPISDVVLLNGAYFLKRTTYLTEGGFLAMQADELASPLVSVSLTARSYDPVADAWTGSSSTVNGFIIRWQSHYRYFAQYALKYEPADAQVLVTKAAVPSIQAGDKLSIGGKAYAVIAAYDEAPVWSLHVRPA